MRSFEEPWLRPVTSKFTKNNPMGLFTIEGSHMSFASDIIETVVQV